MERYRDMQLFVALAEQPSLAAAARRAQVSGPTLIRAIARLEARLRVPLLARSTRGVSLTEAGSAYMADCERLLAAVDAAEASAKGLHVQAQGNLRVFLPLLFSRYVMAPVLADYMERYPDVHLVARYHDYYPNLHEEGLDVAILVGELPSSSLIARTVGQVRHILCASPEYLAANGEPQRPEDLKQHRLIASADQVYWDFQGCQLKARARLSCATVQGAINAAVHGAGLVRCLSYPVHEHLLSGQLRRVLSTYELPPLPVHVVYREGRNAPLRVRSFVDHCVAALREHPAFQWV
ncbi:LysR family transcriptional regulator [Pseudomonas costantinii]|uniref:DNA-binding transcriptional regulator, LysR family n=1 Tax=Pseudomonas costantinii TaxID=168469 RepID=A0A1S2UP64_9PSED|nr:LysR family transcriptional regulator [Pseudomonas costantinii]NVZ21179.1 LysR family transcriptional regulator [Pseudomonas costantinii]OIN48232.1 LysR family transcriptional regulator [Pseudomonas costantinii]SED48630.1 DNA-binding transcriptional regulator, LysR family [Pseudomonas costantinii]